MYDIAKLIHLVAAILWMGGMAFMLLALRPVALSVLQPPERLMLMGGVMRRFFWIVAGSIVALFATGSHLYTAMFRAARLASGQGSVPLGWNVMLALGVLMILVFGHLYFGPFAKCKRALAAQDWPAAGKAAGQVHSLVVLNFVLGWLAIAAVRLLH